MSRWSACGLLANEAVNPTGVNLRTTMALMGNAKIQSHNPTATRSASSSSRRRQEAMGKAKSQSTLWGEYYCYYKIHPHVILLLLVLFLLLLTVLLLFPSFSFSFRLFLLLLFIFSSLFLFPLLHLQLLLIFLLLLFLLFRSPFLFSLLCNTLRYIQYKRVSIDWRWIENNSVKCELMRTDIDSSGYKNKGDNLTHRLFSPFCISICCIFVNCVNKW